MFAFFPAEESFLLESNQWIVSMFELSKLILMVEHPSVAFPHDLGVSLRREKTIRDEDTDEIIGVIAASDVVVVRIPGSDAPLCLFPVVQVRPLKGHWAFGFVGLEIDNSVAFFGLVAKTSFD